MMCSTCGEVIQGGGFPNDLCPGSQQLFQDFAECVCFGGPCEAICGDNVCQGDDPSDGCFDCITGDCNEELNACLNDS